MNYKLLCIVLLVVTGLLSLVIAYLVFNIQQMAKVMNNYTHNKRVARLTKSFELKIEELELDNEEYARTIEYLQEEIQVIRDSRREYVNAFSNLQDCYGSACNTLYNLFKDGLLIKNVPGRTLFNDLVSKGYIEVYNPNKDFNVTKEEIEEIFGTDIFEADVC